MKRSDKAGSNVPLGKGLLYLVSWYLFTFVPKSLGTVLADAIRMRRLLGLLGGSC